MARKARFVLFGVALSAAAFLVAQFPDIRRYMRIRSM